MNVRNVIYYCLWAAWGLVAFPVTALSVVMFRTVPMWPQFDQQATIEGIFVWAAFTAWIYVLPVLLLVTRRWRHTRDDMVAK